MTENQHIALELAKAIIIAQPEKLAETPGPNFIAISTYEGLLHTLESRNPGGQTRPA